MVPSSPTWKPSASYLCCPPPTPHRLPCPGLGSPQAEPPGHPPRGPQWLGLLGLQCHWASVEMHRDRPGSSSCLCGRSRGSRDHLASHGGGERARVAGQGNNVPGPQVLASVRKRHSQAVRTPAALKQLSKHFPRRATWRPAPSSPQHPQLRPCVCSGCPALLRDAVHCSTPNPGNVAPVRDLWKVEDGPFPPCSFSDGGLVLGPSLRPCSPSHPSSHLLCLQTCPVSVSCASACLCHDPSCPPSSWVGS